MILDFLILRLFNIRKTAAIVNAYAPKIAVNKYMVKTLKSINSNVVLTVVAQSRPTQNWYVLILQGCH